MWLGLFAGVAGIEHGYFEIARGDNAPDALGFPSMGPPCVPEQVWYACEPAMSVVPNFLITGLLASALGLLTIWWSLRRMDGRWGGPALIGLSLALLLTGGGIVPPGLGMIGGAAAGLAGLAARRIGPPGGLTAFLAPLWPWPLVGFFIFLLGSVAAGLVIPGFMEGFGYYLLAGTPALLALAILTAWARDRAR
ncbi:MAG: hypothetical protein Q7T08_01635 [Devosia sp.]|nr:hypothetical protein [Devosia sp.]